MIQIKMKGENSISMIDDTNDSEIIIQKDKGRMHFLIGESSSPYPQYAFVLTAEQAQVVKRFLG